MTGPEFPDFVLIALDEFGEIERAVDVSCADDATAALSEDDQIDMLLALGAALGLME